MMAAVMTVLALSTASFANERTYDTFQIMNNGAYDVKIEYRRTTNNYGVWEFSETLHSGGSWMRDAEDIAWVRYRTDVPGYGWHEKIHLNHSGSFNKRETVHHQVDTYGIAFGGHVQVYHSVTPHK